MSVSSLLGRVVIASGILTGAMTEEQRNKNQKAKVAVLGTATSIIIFHNVSPLLAEATLTTPAVGTAVALNIVVTGALFCVGKQIGKMGSSLLEDS